MIDDGGRGRRSGERTNVIQQRGGGTPVTIQSQTYVFGNAWESDPGGVRIRHRGQTGGQEGRQLPERDLDDRTMRNMTHGINIHSTGKRSDGHLSLCFRRP